MGTGSTVLLRIEPDVVKQARVHALPEDASARQAAEVMAETGMGAIVILDSDEKFAGIVTDQDLVREVVAKGRNAEAVRLVSLANRRLECLAPTDLALDALDLMLLRNVDHLPVVVGERMVAVVSIGEICAALRHSLDAELRAHQAAVFGNLLRD